MPKIHNKAIINVEHRKIHNLFLKFTNLTRLIVDCCIKEHTKKVTCEADTMERVTYKTRQCLNIKQAITLTDRGSSLCTKRKVKQSKCIIFFM